MHAEEPKPNPKRPAEDRLSGRLLLAEDDRDIRVLLQRLLRHEGLAVDVAETGLEAVEMALASRRQERPYDLILMDICMPDLDGWLATRRLREQNWSGPIVALTAHATDKTQQNSRQAGCDGCLEKRGLRDALIPGIAVYLGRSVSSTVDVPRARSKSVSSLIDSSAIVPAERARMIGEFTAGLARRIERIDRAASDRNHPALARLVHALKGAAALLGFEQLADLARQAERLAKEKAEPEQLRPAVDALAQACVKTAQQTAEPS